MQNRFPPHLNTRADYEYIRKHFPKEQWQPCWQALLDGKDAWFPVKILAKTDAGIDSATKKVIEQEGADGVLERVQLELKTDPQNKLLQLGFSAAEVEAALN